jgi:hypothetical protein
VKTTIISKWFSPTDKKVTWKKADKICKDNGGRLPTIDELKKVVARLKPSVPNMPIFLKK